MYPELYPPTKSARASCLYGQEVRFKIKVLKSRDNLVSKSNSLLPQRINEFALRKKLGR